MRITRRQGLGLAAAALAMRPAQADILDSEVRAAPAEAAIAPPGYPATRVWAYDGSIPGLGLRLPQGARVRRAFVNDLPEPSTIHWHGIRLVNAMDGVAGLTQEPVPPGGSFTYDFTLPDAGTFWYHPHRNTTEQLGRGLGAPLIVDEAEAPDVDTDEVLFVNDWRLGEDAQIVEDFGALFDASHAGRIGNYLTCNGSGDLHGAARAGDRLRLRLINGATARVLNLSLQGLDGWIMALDGMPVSPQPAGRLILAPAQRVDLFVDVTAEAGSEAMVISHERDGGYALATWQVTQGGPRRDGPPPPLPDNPLTPLGDIDAARTLPLVMEGGAMGGLAGARTPEGEDLDIRSLAQRGLLWAFNGTAGMPETPLADVALGETVRIRIENRTAFPHAMHLHGHHFRLLDADSAGPWRDTVLVNPRETRDIAFVADNPGDWMFHCHMLAHQAAGMMTWLRVA